MTKIVFVILIGLTLLGGGWWFVSNRLLAEPPPPVHPTTQMVMGMPLDTALEYDPLPPVTTQTVYAVPVRGSSLLPKVAAPTQPENAKYGVVQFDTLALFPYTRWLPTPGGPPETPPDQLPAEVKALGGKPASIAGFVQPLDLDDKGKMSKFMLMRSQSLCCYGAPLTLQDWIEVKMDGGQRIEPKLHVPVFVLGMLEVGEDIVNGIFTASLYRMKADKVLAPGEVP